jgi:hypothetical protein
MRLTPLAFLTDSDSAARAAVLRSRHRLPGETVSPSACHRRNEARNKCSSVMSASLIRDTIRRSQKVRLHAPERRRACRSPTSPFVGDRRCPSLDHIRRVVVGGESAHGCVVDFKEAAGFVCLHRADDPRACCWRE